MVVLGLVCTATAFLLFWALIGEIGPVRATVITYLNPAVAAVLGVAVLKEPFTTGMVLGFGLVILGSVMATRPGGIRLPWRRAGLESRPLDDTMDENAEAEATELSA
jgi:drug/metabolite transporter (DMT)-like permease